MNKLVDARGLSCPQPVMLAQKAIEEGVFPIEVLRIRLLPAKKRPPHGRIP